MREHVQVLAHGRGQATIQGIVKESNEAQAIRTWLEARIEVIRIEHQETADLIRIHYHERGQLSGRLVRSLKDKLYTFGCRPTTPFEVQKVHSLPGRVRFKLTDIHPRVMKSYVALAAGVAGVKRTQHLKGSETLLVEYDSTVTNEDKILALLQEKEPSGHRGEDPTPVQIRWGGALASTSVLALCLTRMTPYPIMALGISLVSVRPLRRSIQTLADEGKLSIDALDVAATYAALATGRPATAAFVIWMVGVGDLLLDISANSARSAISKLIQYKEREVCRLLQDGSFERIPIEKLEMGDRFLVQSGQGIAADGRVIEGQAEVDEKNLTGESVLVYKSQQDKVFASTFVVEGKILVEVEVSGKNTEAAKIERVLSAVGNKPLTLQREALEFGGRLVPPTFGVAGIAATLTSSITPAVCVLITDFGTGIRISVPTSALTAMTIAARERILVKGAQYLERLSKTDVIIFDKTGTLTTGHPEIVEVVAHSTFESRKLVQLCASAELNQEHPVADALKSYAKKMGIRLIRPDPETEEYAVGLGMSARVNGYHVQVGRVSWMEGQDFKLDVYRADLERLRESRVSTLCVAIDGNVVGVIGYADHIRPESVEIISQLQANRRRKILLLSGDSPEVVQKVAGELGIDEAVGGLLPAQKADYVRKLKEEGHVVAMVGDGINDAPSLALADVGISIAGSTEVAIETADVILLDGDLLKLPRAFTLSDQTMTRVKQNLGVVIAPNAIAIFLGAFGYIEPSIAAIINNGATLIAVGVATLPLLWTPTRSRKNDSFGKWNTNSLKRNRRLQVVPKIQRTDLDELQIQKNQSDEVKPSLAVVSALPVSKKLDERSINKGVFVRFEDKFFVPRERISEFKNKISKFMNLSFPIAGTQFTDIESIYFDSSDFQIYRMHFSSIIERFKIRTRRYAPNGVYGDRSAHVEYKSKSKGLSRKTRFLLGPKEFGLLWSGAKIPDSSKALGKRNKDLEGAQLKERIQWINTLLSDKQLRPSFIVRYRREAFEGENIRLTIDDQLTFETVPSAFDLKSIQDLSPDMQEAATQMHSGFHNLDYQLVEIKHPGTIPSWMNDILYESDCKKARFSKYCYSVTEALLSGSSGVSRQN